MPTSRKTRKDQVAAERGRRNISQRQKARKRIKKTKKKKKTLFTRLGFGPFF